MWKFYPVCVLTKEQTGKENTVLSMHRMACYVNINVFAQQSMPLTNGIKNKISIVVGI